MLNHYTHINITSPLFFWSQKMQKTFTPTSWYGHYCIQARNHVTRATAAICSCSMLSRTSSENVVQYRFLLTEQRMFKELRVVVDNALILKFNIRTEKSILQTPIFFFVPFFHSLTIDCPPLGRFLWSCALLKWIITLAHLCSNGLSASLKSFQNGCPTQT